MFCLVTEKEKKGFNLCVEKKVKGRSKIASSGRVRVFRDYFAIDELYFALSQLPLSSPSLSTPPSTPLIPPKLKD